MRVLILSEPSYPLHPGGAGKCAHLLAAGLVGRGHTVHLVCPGEATTRESIDGVDVHRVRLPNVRSAAEERVNASAAIDYIEGALAPASIDVVHDCGCFLSHHYRVAQHLKRRHGAASVAHFQFLMEIHERQVAEELGDPLSDDSLWFQSCGHDAPQCFAARAADVLLCASFEEAYHCHRLFRPGPGRVEVVPNPVDLRLRDPAASARLRAEIAAPGELVLMFGGRLDSRMKGADIVFDALRRLADRGLPLRLLTTSNCERADHEFRALLGPRATALGWIKDASRLAITIGAADVMLMPSRYEPFGLMCAEAMAAGVAVIGSPVGGLRQMIRAGHNGFVLDGPPPLWGADLARRIEQIATTPGLARRLGEGALATARAELSMEVVAAEVEPIYARLRASPERQDLVAPAFNPGDHRRYAAVLSELIQAPADGLADEVLAQWSGDLATHCARCVRSFQAKGTHRLLRLGRARPSPEHALRVATHEGRVRAAAHRVCPMSLARLAYLRRWTDGGA